MTIRRRFAGAVILASSALPAVAAAQLEEIIVTAQKRAESLQDVSVSVTALSGEKLAEVGIARVEELAAYVPNLTLSETGIGTTIYIRGIGSGINQGFEQSVGMYVDGVYYGRAQLTRSPFFDMERVEVLRGPQVTLFGNNSIGGALSLSTAKPSDDREASLSFLYEPEYGERELINIVNIPFGETLRGRIAYRSYNHGGYLDNPTLDREEPQRDYETIRFTLAADPTESWSSALKLEYSEFNVKGRQIRIIQDSESNGVGYGNTTFAFGVNGGRPDGGASIEGQTLAEIWSGENFPSNQGAAVIDVDAQDVRYSNGDSSDNQVTNATWTNAFLLPSDHELNVVFAHMDYGYEEVCDCDFSGLDLITYEAEETYEQQSLELRLTSPGGEFIDYITGLYYQLDRLVFDDRLLAPAGGGLDDFFFGISSTAFVKAGLLDTAAPRRFRQRSENAAVFGSMTLNPSDVLRFTLGLRYSYIDKAATRTLDYTAIDGSPLSATDLNLTDSFFTILFRSYRHDLAGQIYDDRLSWNFITEWDINENVMLYLSATDGFKAGGFDVRSNSAPDATGIVNAFFASTFDEEGFIGAFEFDREEALAYELGAKMSIGEFAEINLAYFYTDIENLQLSVFDGALGFNVGNAGAAVSQGIELDGRMALSENLFVNASLSFLDFEFKEYPNGLCTSDELLQEGTSLNDPSTPCENIGAAGARAVPGKDFAGETNQYVADYAGSLGIQYENDFGSSLLWRAGLDVNFTDDYHTTQNLDDRVKQHAFEKYNMRLSVGDFDNVWELALLGRNLTDKRTIGFANNVPLSTTQFGTSTYYGFVSPPRSIALQGKYNF